jgi:hypothetical protein
MIYLHPTDFQSFYQQARSPTTLFLELNGFIVKADKLKEIPSGSVGLSKFHRDAMAISKHDELTIRIAKILDKNPLNSIDLTIDLLYLDDTLPKDQSGAVKIKEIDVCEGVRSLYSGMFVNMGDEVPFYIMNEQIILKAKVNKIENLKDEFKKLTYGVIEEQTDIICKASLAIKSKLKILSDRME